MSILKRRIELTKVLITGANGFIGKNFQLYLSELQDIQVITYTRNDSYSSLAKKVKGIDIVFHLAGINRPKDPEEFIKGNIELTESLAAALKQEINSTGKKIPIVYTSSTQATLTNPYGVSKKNAESTLFKLYETCGTPTYIFRLPNVFGKWCRPNYNSVVATFCHNIIRNIPIKIHDSSAELTLVYIDDVIAHFMKILNKELSSPSSYEIVEIEPKYCTTVGKLAKQLKDFEKSRENLITEKVGKGFIRALYSTYISYLPTESFIYTLPKHEDPRGVFVEMLKTPDAGQFSYFTALPNVTRGGHYHHSKTEKFLVIKGEARFGFKHMLTKELYELYTSGEKPQIVETVPGWTHDITNVGSGELIVMLWANEIFDREKPDTYSCPM